MEGVFGVMAAALAGSIAYLIAWGRAQSRARWWRDAATAAGLSNVQVTTFLGVDSELTGVLGALRVKVESYRRGRHEHGTRIVIGGFRHGEYALSVRAEGVTSAIEKSVGEREIELGDPVFDEAAFVRGAPALIRALFDAETRAILRPLLRGTLHVEGPAGSRTFERLRVSVSNDELRIDVRSSPFDNTDKWLPAILPLAIEAAGRLQRPDDLARRIADNIRHEPLETVRLANLHTLASEFSRHEAARTALKAALQDRSPAVRLEAALSLGPEGRRVLLDLVSSDAPDGVAARAIDALGAECPVDLAIARLGRARAGAQLATAVACLALLGRPGSPPAAVAELAAALAAADERLARAAAQALGRTGAADAETPLIAALEHASGDVRVAAADALGLLGSPLAVVPLREAAADRLIDLPLRRAARQAVAAIQSRVTGASPGQISLADDNAGQISLAEEDARGRLSLHRAAQEQRTAGGS